MPLLHPGTPFPEQCSTLPTYATSLAAGSAAPASAIPAPFRCCPTSPIPRTRWNPSRRRGAHLLVPARHRHRPGNVRSAMTARLLLGRLRKAMRSADAARSRPDEVAVSPAIGPLPAIIVPVNRPIPAHPVDNPRPGAGGVTAWVRGGRVRDGGWSLRGDGPWRRRLRGYGAAGRSGRPGRTRWWRRGRGRSARRRRRAGRPAGRG
jgi:hypothetical protein